MAFDDRSTIIVLEFLVRRLIVRRCADAEDPKAELQNWVDALAAHRDLTIEFAFNHAGTEDAQLNAVSAAGEMDRISEEIVSDVADSGIEI